MISKLLIPVGISVVIYFAIALALILSQRPATLTPATGLDFSGVLTQGPFQVPSAPGFTRTSALMSDGTALPVTHVNAPDLADDAPLIIMIHGSGWHGQQFDRFAWNLRDVAEVKALTLRGHGEAPERRGDVDYIGQLEDDIADLIAAHPNRKAILLGHSSGGGLVIRLAGGKHADLMAGAILLAPFLHHNAPTLRENSGGWTQVLLRRVIGLSMLNTLRIRALNHLTMIQFDMPAAVLDGPQGKFATTAYSYRLNTSFAPRSDYLSDISGLPDFLLVAGTQDEAFKAELYAQTMGAATDKGRYELVPDTGHLDIVDAPQTERLIREYLRDL